MTHLSTSRVLEASSQLHSLPMSCPDGRPQVGGPCCVELAGESPVAVSAGALRSRLQSTGGIPEAERSVESHPEERAVTIEPLEWEQSRGPSIK